MVQFNRQLDYGTFGGTAQYEGGIGEDTTASYQRITVPMSYYSTYARASIAANMAQAFDGIKAEDRVENDAEMKLVADIEFDLFRGQDDFSNGGVFDGSPAAIAEVPNLIGLFAQVRIADTQSSAQDLMFAEYGGSRPVVLPINGNLRQTHLEDASVISSMNHGSADKVILDPIALSSYNKIAFAKERIVLAGAAHESTGANLRKQWTSAGMAELEASRFLSGKTAPARPRAGSPAAPAAVAAATASTAIIPAGTYDYYVSAVNERGESVATKVAAVVVVAGEKVTLTITNNGAKYYNVYRAEQGKMRVLS